MQLFEEGVDGFLWWSSLEASWTNAEREPRDPRPKEKLKLVEPLVPLTTHLPSVQQAASRLKI